MRSSPDIGAAMIVRNEERFLDDCLASIAGQVDEIVLVDTGSTDLTLEIAGRYGARIIEYPWSDDFSAARNHALDHASSDWILYIDADERLGPRRTGRSAPRGRLRRGGGVLGHVSTARAVHAIPRVALVPARPADPVSRRHS